MDQCKDAERRDEIHLLNETASHHSTEKPLNGSCTLEEQIEEMEDYVLAHIRECNPFQYIFSVLRSIWCHGSSKPSSLHCGSTQTLNWKDVVRILLLKTLLLGKFLESIEPCVNIVVANQNIWKTLYRYFFDSDALTKPNKEDDNYYSIGGYLDPRVDLLLNAHSDTSFPAVLNLDSTENARLMADLCMMASKLAYENSTIIKRVVNQNWKLNFIYYYDCWNEYLKDNTTQAFIFTDRAQDAKAIVVAFRGTQPFNMLDWCTDFDFSYFQLGPDIGRVHVGFLEALGLANRATKMTLTDVVKNMKRNAFSKAASQISPQEASTSGLPKNVIDDGNKLLAYDEICAKVRVLLRENPGAKLYVTGHSLGGSLATLFTGLLLFELEEETAPRLGGVFTFGQPRVGDPKFAKYMTDKLCASNDSRKYFRVVFRTDVVPHVPCEGVLFGFKHTSPCLYYYNCLEAKVLTEQPYRNIWSFFLLPMPHISAVKELFASLKQKLFRKRNGEDDGYVESWLSIFLIRFWAVLLPGVCAHFPSSYVDAIRKGPSDFLFKVEETAPRISWSTRLHRKLASFKNLCRLNAATKLNTD